MKLHVYINKYKKRARGRKKLINMWHHIKSHDITGTSDTIHLKQGLSKAELDSYWSNLLLLPRMHLTCVLVFGFVVLFVWDHAPSCLSTSPRDSPVLLAWPWAWAGSGLGGPGLEELECLDGYLWMKKNVNSFAFWMYVNLFPIIVFTPWFDPTSTRSNQINSRKALSDTWTLLLSSTRK